MFTVRGQLKIDPEGRPKTVSWDAGMLLGDHDAIHEVVLGRFANADRQIGPVGGPYYTGPDPLNNPLASATLINDIFVPGTMVSFGDVPTRSAVPEGAEG